MAENSSADTSGAADTNTSGLSPDALTVIRRVMKSVVDGLARADSTAVARAATASTEVALLMHLIEFALTGMLPADAASLDEARERLAQAISAEAAVTSPEDAGADAGGPDDALLVRRIERAIVRATEALGTREKAMNWLATPNRALAGGAPVALLWSEDGAAHVEAILVRIEHGVHG
ncbi:MbcA/ParS/Xre antitoxin family protein [Gemmatimonas sp.]|uniref:MbcA/ParS/Xre antitoxin family protein n=1 Tax=Gemmatimonas sp. TaxID=1962908 RepID=UPI0025BA3CBB|nr:MbcA/ParS/Xre antitoxin family protein [Gemmatimonas sp.]MCA2991522.1 DUF2384 domain-containing protein [Gemmatimonas sp.]